MGRKLRRDVLDSLRERPLVGEEEPVGAADVVNLLAREATPAQPDDVEARKMGAVAIPYGMTSFSIPDRPPMKACWPMRTNW